jgi:hypothetical protein
MSRLLLILILTLSLQSWSKADDIKDFEIEGISIGDSALDYFTKDKILSKSKSILSGGKRYYEWNQINKVNSNKLYDSVVIYFKADDKNYIIKKISARNYYTNNIEDCYNEQIIIENEIKKIVPNLKKTEIEKVKVPAFPNGKSYQSQVFFDFIDGSYIGIWCLDYSIKDTTSRDRLSVVVATKEYLNWQHSKDRK